VVEFLPTLVVGGDYLGVLAKIVYYGFRYGSKVQFLIYNPRTPEYIYADKY
jgi:hypothetical protein